MWNPPWSSILLPSLTAFKVIKRSRMLGEIARGQKCLAVAGTHGKTTTSTLVAHIFTDSSEDTITIM